MLCMMYILLRLFNSFNAFNKDFGENVYFRLQILEHPSIGEYWKISSVPVGLLPENVIFTFFRAC